MKLWSGKTGRSALLIIITYKTEPSRQDTTNVQIFLFLSWLACSRDRALSLSFSFCLRLSLSLSLSFFRSLCRSNRYTCTNAASSFVHFFFHVTTAGKRAGESISHTETFRPRPRLCRRELLAPFEGRSHRLSRIRRCKRTESLINLSFYPMPCDRRIRVSIARTCESTCVKRANVVCSIAIYLTAMKISTLYFFIKLYGTLGVIEHSILSNSEYH